MNRSLGILAALSVALLCPQLPEAQSPATQPAKPRPCSNITTENTHTFYLKNAYDQYQANEIYTALRQLLPPDDKSYLVPSQNIIVLCGRPEEIALAQELLNNIDKPKKTYKLTYSVTEFDGTRRISSQHFSMAVAPGQNTVLKEGSKVPIATGTTGDSKSNQTQFSYIDIGMNFDATLSATPSGAMLKSNVEQSSVGEEKTIMGVQEPVIRSTSLRGEAFLTPGKPMMLGSLDIPGSTHHLEVEVVMEPIS